MSKSKKWLGVSVLFVMLVVVAAMPVFLTNYHNNNKLIGSINIVPLEAGLPSSNAVSSGDYNVRDRLRIISGKVAAEYVNVSDTKISSDKMYADEEIIENMEGQLIILQQAGILPQLSLGNGYSGYVSKKTYLDTKSSAASVSVWEIHALYPDFSIDAYMDADTSLLYDISIYYPDGMPVITSSDAMISEGFCDYLQLNSDAAPGDTERFMTRLEHSGNSIYLSVVSYDDGTGLVTFYDFKNVPSNSEIANSRADFGTTTVVESTRPQ